MFSVQPITTVDLMREAYTLARDLASDHAHEEKCNRIKKITSDPRWNMIKELDKMMENLERTKTNG